MKTTKLIMSGAVLLALVLAGCSPDDPEQKSLDITQPTGTAALERYVAIGNSLTAGYMDSGLIMNGQFSSFPLQIAMQLGYSPSSAVEPWFAQPFIAWPGVGSTQLSDPTYAAGVLHWNGSGIAVRDSTPLVDVQSTLLLAASWPTPYNNLGVPGAAISDVTNALDSGTSQSPGNRYFDFILRNPTFGDVNMLNQAISQGPTLATVWIGNNDILGGSIGGDPEVGVNVTPGAAFRTMLEGIISGLANGVHDRFGYDPHLVVGNIPSITSIPYFIPKAQFDTIVGIELPTEEENVVYMTFPTLRLVQSGGFTPPIPSTGTLTEAEVTAVENEVDAYNTAIDELAAEYDYTVVDIHALLGGLSAPANTHFLFLVMNGMSVEDAAGTTYFSLDGIHPNNRGYSLVANEFIAGINAELELTGDDALVEVPEQPWDPTYPVPVSPTLAELAAH